MNGLRRIARAPMLVTMLIAGAITPARVRAEHAPETSVHRGGPAGDEREDGDDPLIPMLRRIDRFMQSHEVGGVVMDARYVVNATEAARLSVVSQLLAYTELYKVTPSRRVRRDITDRADYLIARLDDVRSGSVFDGMLGYALLEAYAETGERRELDAGASIAGELESLPRTERVLNGGLMGAMALTKYHLMTGDPAAQSFVDDVMASLPAYQHANGSFPHWCACSTDIHYTDWMATELILIGRMTARPDIEPMLGRIRGFLDARIDARGMTHYEDSCAAYPGCTIPYYSIATGCGIDYDTRAWTNELGYSALLFDHAGSPTYGRVMGFVGSLERRGTFPDKWDFWPPASDPYYVWTAADTSVINTSLIFWSLASVLSGRHGAAAGGDAWLDQDDGDRDAGSARSAAALRAIDGPASPARAPRRNSVDSLLVAGTPPERYCTQVASPLEPPVSMPPAPGPDAEASARLEASASAAPMAAAGVTVRVALGSRGAVAIRFTLPVDGPVSLDVYDPTGRRVRGLVGGTLAAGPHAAEWDRRDDAGRACPSGVYFVAIRAAGVLRAARVATLR